MTRALWLLAVTILVLGPRAARADGQAPRAPSGDDVPASAGFHGTTPFVRAFDDRVRLYPELALRLDATWSPKPEVPLTALGADEAGAHLRLRRLRFGLSGEILRHVAFTAELEMGGQRIGRDDPSAPAATMARWVPASAHDGVVRPGEVSLSATPWRGLSFTIGHITTPFSMSNRTPEAAVTYMERPLGIRGLAVPNERALGASVWGETNGRSFAYELGVMGPAIGEALGSGDADLAGRVFVRPFTRLGRGVFYELAQIGVSARLGTRSQGRGLVDDAGLATGQGFVMWRPTTANGALAGRSSAQRAVGGELRLPFRTPTRAVFDLRAEAYLVRDETAGLRSNGVTLATDPRGRIAGAVWYVSLDWWACFIPGFEQLVTGEPGITRPKSLDDRRAPVAKSAFYASVLAGGVNADYVDPSRDGRRDVTIYQLGGTAAYVLGTALRASFEYMAFVAPNAGDPSRSDVVMPYAFERGHARSRVTHEVGVRLGVGL